MEIIDGLLREATQAYDEGGGVVANTTTFCVHGCLQSEILRLHLISIEMDPLLLSSTFTYLPFSQMLLSKEPVGLQVGARRPAGRVKGCLHEAYR